MSEGSASPLPEWPCHLGVPGARGVIRLQPEDFRVEEIPLIEPSGEGSHLWLEVQKRCANTHWVAGQLSAAAGIAMRDTGYAGMKDRHGVTSQWFSLAMQEAQSKDWKSWNIPDVTILRGVRNRRKLKTGALRGNRFRIVVRELEGNIDELEQRLASVKSMGAPNYFGPQRFGFDGSNVQRGIYWLENGGRLPRQKRSIYISAVRSFLFNQLLAKRVGDGSWNRILDGEIAMLNGSRSVFECALPDPELTRRCSEFDIHPSGILAGSGGKRPGMAAAQHENDMLVAYAPVVDSLERSGAKAGRRALRLLPGDLEWKWDGDALIVRFELMSGSYATSLLRELVSCTERIHIPAS